MKRRDFIGMLGGAVASPFTAHAQQNQGVRRIGVLQPFPKDNPERARVDAFLQELQRLGWTDGRNLHIDYRWETRELRNAAGDQISTNRIYAGC
jgi:putative ABC transport system substrate-binding protein